MSSFFSMDKGFFRVLTKIYDCIFLSILFVITSIPVITIGASWTALYYTVQKVLKNDRGYISKEYWHALKTNFKQATCIWLIMLAIGVVLGVDIKILWSLAEKGESIGKAYLFFGILLILEVIWCSYVFPYIARFENTNGAVMKNAAIFAILNFPRTLLVGVYMVIAVMLIYMVPFLILILPAAFTWMQNMVLEKVFRKYMSEEDRAAEDELNREYKN